MSAPPPKVVRLPKISLIWLAPLVALAVAGWLLVREWRNHGPEITIEFSRGTGLEAGQTKLEYKGIEVGEVKAVELARDLSHVIARVQLARDAEAIARTGSRFWIVQPEIGFSGINGLDTLLSGAHLSVRLGHGPPATRFRGLDAPPSPENAEAGRSYLVVSDRLGGLNPHAPVLYRDIKVGEVEAAQLTTDGRGVSIRIRVLKPYTDLVRANTQFWNAGGSPLQISLFGGEAPKKSLQSIITGALEFATPDEPGEVAADGAVFPLHPKSEKEWLEWHPEIPLKVPDSSEPRRTPAKQVVPGLVGG